MTTQTRTPGSVFNTPEIADSFIRHYEALRGRVRMAIIRRHLAEVILGASSPMRVLDMGAGDGRDALWLAELGHDVLAVDPADLMVARAQEMMNRKTAPLRGRLEIRAGDLSSIVEDSFDLILSHGVLMYQAEPATFLGEHLKLLRPGGFLSILTKNSNGLSFRAASEGHLDEALRLLDSNDSTGHLDLVTRAHSVQDLSDYVGAAGGVVRSWAGVRIFTDYGSLLDSGVDEDRAIELEWKSCRMDPQRQIASLIHVIVCKGIDMCRLPG